MTLKEKAEFKAAGITLDTLLKYVDKNLSGVPSERYLTSCQAIVVPRELLEKATKVKLTIVSE